MLNDLVGCAIFFAVTSITPGPNNITSLSFSLANGYRRTLPYMLGIISGVFSVSFSMALLMYFASSTDMLTQVFHYMRYVGAAYILYLTYKTLMMNVSWQSETTSRPTFWDGYLLQPINPKLYFFTTTMLTTFVNYDEASVGRLFLLALAHIMTTFTCISIWAMTGSVLRDALQNPLYKRIFGGVMALGLLYTAYRILVV